MLSCSKIMQKTHSFFGFALSWIQSLYPPYDLDLWMISFFLFLSLNWCSASLFLEFICLSTDEQCKISSFQGSENESLDEWHPCCLRELMTLKVSIRVFLFVTLGLTSFQTLRGAKHMPDNVLWDFREWNTWLSLSSVDSQANKGTVKHILWCSWEADMVFCCLFADLFWSQTAYLKVIASWVD